MRRRGPVYIRRPERVIRAAGRLGIRRATMRVGRDPKKLIDASRLRFTQVRKPLIAMAERGRFVSQ
jgi:hypothetical protein